MALDIERPEFGPSDLAIPQGSPRLQLERPLNDIELAMARSGHVLDYVKILYRRRWSALTVFLLVVVTVAVHSFTAIPIYEASVRLIIDAENQNVVNFKPVVSEDQTRADYYQTQASLLQSRSLARRTLDELKLWQAPGFGSAGAARQSFSLTGAITGGLSSSVRWAAGLFQSSNAPAIPPLSNSAETGAESRAIDALLGGLSVQPVRNSRLFDLKYRSADPVLATNLANIIAKMNIEQNLEFKFLASKEAGDWLAARLAEERKKVENSEAALQRYKEQNDAVSLTERQDIVVQKLADLNGAVTRAKTERIQKESVYLQLKSLESDRNALDSFPAILANGFIQQQKTEVATLQSQIAQQTEKLGDRHPDMIKLRTALQTAQAKLQGEIGKVVQAVRNEYLSSQAQERSLTEALDAQKGEALALNRKGIDYNVLLRDAQSNRQIYDSLLERAKQAGVSGELKVTNMRIIDPAETPRSPISPNVRLNLLLALFSGSLLGLGTALFIEYLDNRIKTPDEVKNHLGLVTLGLIPRLHSLNGNTPLISGDTQPRFAEAFRSVRTNVLFASPDAGARSILVTSTGPNEGKTTVAANLAVGLAMAGQRVLLIDADLRRPRLHQVFSQPQEPGLSNLLVGMAKASEAVQKTSVSGLWLLPSGKVSANPAELVSSQRFRDFLATLRDHFEWVVLDSPPTMAVTDAVVLAHSVTAVVFVVRAEATSRNVARVAIEQLHSAGGQLLGAVLNSVDLDRNAYYYSQYYRREYASYYEKTAGL